jgi:hypothetical protein
VKEQHASVPLRRSRSFECLVRSFSTNSRPALRAASGRLRPGDDTTVTGVPASPSNHGGARAVTSAPLGHTWGMLQRTAADNPGQLRTPRPVGSPARTPLTSTRPGTIPSMACKESGVQIPSAPPQVNGPSRRRPPGNRPPRAANRQQSPLRGRSSVRHGGAAGQHRWRRRPADPGPPGPRPAAQYGKVDRSQIGEQTSSLSGFCPGPVSPGWHLRPGRTIYRWRPLGTARFRWRVDQTWTKPLLQSVPVEAGSGLIRPPVDALGALVLATGWDRPDRLAT